MTDYDPKEIFKEPIFLNTIPENIDISEEKYEGIVLIKIGSLKICFGS